MIKPGRASNFVANLLWKLSGFLLIFQGANFVVATKFNQDVLEKFFGKLRQKRGAYGVFTCNKFIYSYCSSIFSQSHAIKTVWHISMVGVPW